jgi:hypothetical protein
MDKPKHFSNPNEKTNNKYSGEENSNKLSRLNDICKGEISHTKVELCNQTCLPYNKTGKRFSPCFLYFFV